MQALHSPAPPFWEPTSAPRSSCCLEKLQAQDPELCPRPREQQLLRGSAELFLASSRPAWGQPGAGRRGRRRASTCKNMILVASCSELGAPGLEDDGGRQGRG